MSIEITGTFPSGKSPRILHEGNRFKVKTVTASAEATNYPGTAADLGNTVDRWRPFANEIDSPTDLSVSPWATTNVTVGADGQTLDAGTATGLHYIQQAFTYTAGEWVLSFQVERQTSDGVTVYADDGTSTRFTRFDLRDATVVSDVAGSVGTVVDLGNGVFECRIYFTAAAGTGNARIYFWDAAANESYTGANETFRVLRASAHLSSATLRYDLFTMSQGDCIAIAAHNLGSSGARIQIEHDNNNDGGFVAIDELSPTDDSPIMFFFDDILSSRWRITVDRGALPEVGVFRVGAALRFERAFYGGFTVPRMSRNTEVIGNLSGSGQLLGRSKKRTTLNAQYQWSNLTYDFVRLFLDGPNGLIQSLETGPAFVAWRPSLTEDVEYLMRGSVTAPVAQGTADLHSFSMSGEAHAYE